MKLFTSVELPSGLPRFDQARRLLLFGSCFATEMGQCLARAKFRCSLNPYGVLYNPLSIAKALEEIMDAKEYTAADLFQHNGLWHSPMHHSDFSGYSVDEVQAGIAQRQQEARKALAEPGVLILTWGTAYVYQQAQTGVVVGNCHKLPERMFERRRLEVDEVTDVYISLFDEFFSHHPDWQVVLTVSPIRHLRDGLHPNQLSKATLLLAADRLADRYPGSVHYFPAYELLMDELRDYRFYADDLCHPSSLAVEHVWQCFKDCCFTPKHSIYPVKPKKLLNHWHISRFIRKRKAISVF